MIRRCAQRSRTTALRLFHQPWKTMSMHTTTNNSTTLTGCSGRNHKGIADTNANGISNNDHSSCAGEKPLDLKILSHYVNSVQKYNNWLPRQDISTLEEFSSFLSALNERVQTELHQRKQLDSLITNTYTPSESFRDLTTIDKSFLDTQFLNAFRFSSGQQRPLLQKHKVHNLLTEAGEGIYSFPLFNKSFCKSFIDETVNFERWRDQHGLGGVFGTDAGRTTNNNNNNNVATAPHGGSSSRKGILISHLQLRPLFANLIRDYLLPIVSLTFPELEFEHNQVTEQLTDSFHAYVLHYRARSTTGTTQQAQQQNQQGYPTLAHTPTEENTKLNLHSDDAEITVNICLGVDEDYESQGLKRFQGGDLLFGGFRNNNSTSGTAAARTGVTEYKHAIGHALVHKGQHFHEVKPLVDGDRFNIIIWLRSAQYRHTHCHCCLIYNRHHDDCIYNL